MLPFQTLSGYPFNIVDEDSLPCFGGPAFMHGGFFGGPIFGGFSPSDGKVDVYGTFEVRHHVHLQFKPYSCAFKFKS